MSRRVMLLGVPVVLAGLAGCVHVKAPERIVINGEPPPVDAQRVPETASHEDCRAELLRAYQNIQYLERENARLKQRADEYKRQRDEARQRLKRYED